METTCFSYCCSIIEIGDFQTSIHIEQAIKSIDYYSKLNAVCVTTLLEKEQSFWVDILKEKGWFRIISWPSSDVKGDNVILFINKRPDSIQ